MEKRIELEKRHRKPEQLRELNLDNCRSTTVEGLTEDFSNLEVLSCNGVGLTSLKGFPTLAKLRKLELSDNRISGGLQALKSCTRLDTLNLSNNRIKDLETLEPLKELVSLKSLDLYRNEITVMDDYRQKVFELLPDLQYLDGTDRNNKEADESEDEKDANGEEEEDEDDDGVEVDEEEDDDDDEDDDDEEEDLELGLKAIYNDNLKDSDGEDYDGEEEGGEEEESEDDDEGTLNESGNSSLPLESEPKAATATTAAVDADSPSGSATASSTTAASASTEKRGVKRQHEGSSSDEDE